MTIPIGRPKIIITLTQNWEEVGRRDFTRGRQRNGRSGPSQVVCNFIDKDTRVAGRPEEFDNKVSLIKRENNTLYAENRRRMTGIEKVTN